MGDERTSGEGAQPGAWGQPQAPPPAPGAWGQPQAPPPPPGWQPQPAWGQPPGAPPRPSTNGPAIAALVCGLLSIPLVIMLVGGLVGVVAVVLGAVGVSRARTTGSGRGMAIAGIVTGALAIVLTAGLIALGVQVWQDPEFQDLLEEIEEEQRRQEQLLEDAEQG